MLLFSESHRITQQALDKEIAAHRAAICTLSKKRNELSAINRLPNDILSEIFVAYKQLFCLSPEEEEDYYEATRRSVIAGAWTNVLSICSHWRNIIVDTPRFWSTIAFSPARARLMPLFLDRSKSVPLVVQISMFNYSPSKSKCFSTAVEHVVSESARLASLHVDFQRGNEPDAENLFQAMAEATPASLLRLLEIDFEKMGGSGFDSVVTLSGLPWGSLSSLRVLNLGNVLFPADAVQLPSLDTLFVSCTLGNDRLTIEWIVTFLSHTPNIKVIHLQGVTCRKPIQSPLPRVCLPGLRTLTLHCQELASIKLLEYLDCPLRTMQTTFSVWNKYPANDQNLKALPALLAGNASSPLTRTNMRLIATNSLQLLPVDETVQYPNLELSIPFLSRSIDVFCSAPLTHITEFILQPRATHNTAVVPGNWLSLLHAMTDLQLLTFFGCGLSFIRDLVKGISGNVFLNTLSFKQVLWIESRTVEARHIPEVLDALRTFCDQRQKDGHAISKLIFRNCGIMPETIDAFKGFVVVDWDGNGLEFWREGGLDNGLSELQVVDSDESMTESEDEA